MAKGQMSPEDLWLQITISPPGPFLRWMAKVCLRYAMNHCDDLYQEAERLVGYDRNAD